MGRIERWFAKLDQWNLDWEAKHPVGIIWVRVGSLAIPVAVILFFMYMRGVFD